MLKDDHKITIEKIIFNHLKIGSIDFTEAVKEYCSEKCIAYNNDDVRKFFFDTVKTYFTHYSK